MIDKIYRFWVTTISGLEEVVVDDLKERLPGIDRISVQKGKRQGQIYFDYERSPRNLLGLKSVLGGYAQIWEMRDVTVGRPGLERICKRIAETEFDSAQSLIKGCLGTDVESVRFQLNVTVQGAHRFTPSQLSQRVRDLLIEKHGLTSGGEREALHLQLKITGKRAVFGLRLPGIWSRASGDEFGRVFTYCLGRLLDIRVDDAVVCLHTSGVGVKVLKEEFGVVHLCSLYEDLSGAKRARDYGKGQGRHSGLCVLCSDTMLPVAAGSCDFAIGRLPQHRWDMVGEIFNAVHPGGVTGLLVPDVKAFMGLLNAAGLPCELIAGIPVSMSGRMSTLVILQRLEEVEDGNELISIELF